MNQNRNLLAAFGIVVANVLIGHLFPPTSIMLTPFVLPLIVSILTYIDQRLSLAQKLVASICLIILHDLGVKLFAGGMNDQAGLAWIHLTLIIGLIAAYVPILVLGFKPGSGITRLQRASVVIAYPVALIPYYFLSANVGH